MVAKLWNGTSWVDLTTLKMWNGSAWVDLTIGKMWNGTDWVDFLGGGGGGSGALSVTANRGTVHGLFLAVSPGPYPLFKTVTSDPPVVISVSNGTGPYTCEWVHHSGNSALQVVSPNSFTTNFYANVAREQYVAGTKTCIVTDSLGATGSVNVGGLLEYFTDL